MPVFPKKLGVPSRLLEQAYRKRGIARLSPYQLPVFQIQPQHLEIKSTKAAFTEKNLYAPKKRIHISPYWGLNQEGQTALSEAHRNHPRALVVRWPKQGTHLALPHRNPEGAILPTGSVNVNAQGTDAAMREATITLARTKGMIPNSVIHHPMQDWKYQYHPKTMHRDGSDFQVIHHHPVAQEKRPEHVLNIAVAASSVPPWIRKHSRKIKTFEDDMSNISAPYYVHSIVRRPHASTSFLLDSNQNTKKAPPTMHQAVGGNRSLTTLLFSRHNDTEVTNIRASDWGLPIIQEPM